MSKTRIGLGEEQRSCCPLSSFLDLFGDRWTLLILRDIQCGKSLFKHFLASPEKIATNTLTDRLKRLVENGIVERVKSDDWKPSQAYALTARGKSLLPLLTDISDWGLKHIAQTEKRMTPVSGPDRRA